MLGFKSLTMWRKQCHVYHPWLGVASISPMAYIFMMTGGWLWHSFTHTISVCSENHPFTSSHRRAISFRHAMTGSIHRFFKSKERHAYWNWLCEHWNWSNLRYKLVGGWPTLWKILHLIAPYWWGSEAVKRPHHPLWKIWVRQLGWWHSLSMEKYKMVQTTSNKNRRGDLCTDESFWKISYTNISPSTSANSAEIWAATHPSSACTPKHKIPASEWGNWWQRPDP